MNAVGFTTVFYNLITIKYLSLFSLDTNIKNLNTPDIGTVQQEMQTFLSPNDIATKN